MQRIESARVLVLTIGAVALLAATVGALQLGPTPALVTVAGPTPMAAVSQPPSIAVTVEDLDRCDCTHAADAGHTPREATALLRACEATRAPDCDRPWSVFATLPDAVVVRRSTGDCGGCGALAVATVFRGDEVQAHAELGTFGRFGNGPDAAEWITVAGRPALVVDSSESMGGYSYGYRTFYWVEDDAIREGRCLVMEYSNAGAREDGERWEWRATMAVRTDGAFDVRYRVDHRGANAPRTPRSFHIPAGRVRALANPDEGECVGPEWNDDPDAAVSVPRVW